MLLKGAWVGRGSHRFQSGEKVCSVRGTFWSTQAADQASGAAFVPRSAVICHTRIVYSSHKSNSLDISRKLSRLAASVLLWLLSFLYLSPKDSAKETAVLTSKYCI